MLRAHAVRGVATADTLRGVGQGRLEHRGVVTSKGPPRPSRREGSASCAAIRSASFFFLWPAAWRSASAARHAAGAMGEAPQHQRMAVM